MRNLVVAAIACLFCWEIAFAGGVHIGDDIDNRATARANAEAVGVGVGVGIGEGGDGGNAYSSLYNAPNYLLSYDQALKLTVEENLFVSNAPGLAAAGECIGSSSAGIGPISAGGTREPDGCAAWRDVNQAVKFGFPNEVVFGFMCQYKNFRKLSSWIVFSNENGDAERLDCNKILRGHVEAKTYVAPAAQPWANRK